ncbi:MAG: VWA domain-containing protein [bacterium]|nr:VWA domain-containing protein [bacterium]
MIVISSPWMALLLALPCIYLYFSFKKGSRRTSAIKFPMLAAVKASANLETGRIFQGLSHVMRFVALCLIVLALMRFQSRTPLPASDAGSFNGSDIIVCLDTSPSMLALDFGRNDRLTVAKEVIAGFIKERKDDRIGLVVFSGACLTLCPLTVDHDALLRLTGDITHEITKSDGTAIGDAIAVSINRLKNSKAKSKVIILVTDGSNNMGHIDPNTAADMASELGIKIYSIGVGKGGRSVIPSKDMFGVTRYFAIEDSLDENSLTEIALKTGGEYQRARSADSLKSIFEKIDSLEKTEFKKKASFTYRELFGFFLIPALIILLIDIIFVNTAARRIP